MKYMIEIEDVPFSKVRFDDNGAQNINLYRAKGFNSLVFDQFGLDKLTPLDKALDEAYQKGIHDGSIDVKQRVDGAYQKGFESGQHEATTLEYQQGLNDAWECAKYLFSEMSNTEINLVFPHEWNNGGFKALMALDPKDAIDRINAFERKQESDEIKVGDEVMSNNAISDHTGVVLALSPGENSAKVLENDGSMAWVAVNVLIKTGRHFNFLASLLNAMKEGAE